MKNTLKYLIMNLALVGTATFVLPACGTVASETCTTNEDCTGEGEVCNADTSTCEVEEEDTSCTDSTECTGEGELCLPSADDETVTECRVAADCSEAADPAAYCTAELGETLGDNETGACNTDADPVCVAESTIEYRYIQIVDSSEGDSSCKSVPGGSGGADPGSDIMYVQLLDDQGEVLGYAKNAAFTEGTNDADEANGFTDADTVFSGEAPELGDDQCPVEAPAGSGNKFRADSIVSLGCGGSLVVEFRSKDDIETVLDLIAGQKVDVGEFGPYCTNPDGSEGSDTYDVYLCETDKGVAAADIDVDLDCLVELGVDAQGQTGFDVKLMN